MTTLGKFSIAWYFMLVLNFDSFGQEQLSLEHPTYQLALRVFEDVGQSFGTGQTLPVLKVVTHTSRQKPIIADYRREPEPTIRISEDLISLCKELGPDSLNALAYLLGHELAHHFQRHSIYGTYTAQNSKEVGIAAETQLRFAEAEADRLGCYYAQIAGYQPTVVVTAIIKRIYSRYHLPPKLPGYPSLSERIRTGALFQDETRSLGYISQAGQLLYATGQFAEAAASFDYVSRSFRSREIFNNMACAYLQTCLHKLPPDEQAFVYPVEFDAYSRLRLPVPPKERGNAPAMPDLILLKKAETALQNALRLDETYLPARINLACVHLLRNNPDAVTGLLNDSANLPADAHTVRAIAYLKQNRIERAADEFQAAVQGQGYFAAYNQALFERQQRPMRAAFTEWIEQWFRTNPPPEALTRRDWRLPPPHKPAGFGARVSNLPYVYVRADTTAPHGLSIKTAVGTFVWLPLPGRARPTPISEAGFSPAGLSKSDIRRQMGIPNKQHITTMGRFWVYSERNLVFEFDRSGQVKGWGRFNKP